MADADAVYIPEREATYADWLNAWPPDYSTGALAHAGLCLHQILSKLTIARRALHAHVDR